MAVAVSQTSFDALVEENVTEFELTWDDAVVEAIKELQLQGIKNFKHLDTAQPTLRKSETEYGDLLCRKNAGLSTLEQLLKSSVRDCNRFLRSPNIQAFFRLLDELIQCGQDTEAIESCCRIIQELNKQCNRVELSLLAKIQCNVLQSLPQSIEAVRATTVLCKISPEWSKKFIDYGGFDLVVDALMRTKNDPDQFCDVCDLLAALADPRVMPTIVDVLERARILCRSKHAVRANIPQLTTKFSAVEPLFEVAFQRKCDLSSDATRRSNLCATNLLSCLARAQDITEILQKRNIISLIKSELSAKSDAEMTTSTLTLLRNLCGDDACKADATNENLLEDVVNILKGDSVAAPVLEISAGCIAAMCLRCPIRAEMVASYGGLEVLFDTLQDNITNYEICRAICMAIRNLGSRSENVRSQISDIEYSEKLLRDVRQRYKKLNDIVHVTLRELNMLADSELHCPFNPDELRKC
mmetsp:Transcript_5610/g.16707  ORF Transcript_5610/g.16707 Transcript_5610/m.16707 type:complete len:470 (-) Transcript_5610:37-1446(-)